ncbi:hypothetical protein QW060_10170 [Myroides ceti]|uniref:Phosphoribosylpyrophosphate synthetase n=1 Tax=Paenimyroides ceti TaxID=395087 RepID=A0ABT8CUS1_9FLAO|nr:hypothetical protein [Paenimyroides ceti]MDN3707496.1 hypothetical protein [Paenimyroides ceti]
MKKMHHYATAEKALRELEEKGYNVDFNVEETRIIVNPDDFRINHIYRYEGMSNPGDESTVYGIEQISNGEKGVFVAGDLSFNEDGAARVLLNIEINDKKSEG